MAININGVSYKYGKSLVLDDLSFQIEESHITGIYGDSGSGKTTLAKILSNVILPNNGYINSLGYILNNKLKNQIKYKRKIGYLPQQINCCFNSDTVKGEIEFVLKNNKYKKNEIDNKLNELCSIFEIDKNFLNKRIDSTTIFEKKLTLLMCAFSTNPNLIILDEPFIGMDSNNKKKLINYIKELKSKYNKTIIIMSSNIDELIKFVDDIVIIKKGKCITYGKRIDVISNISIFEKNEIQAPQIIEFSKKVRDKKNIKIGYYDDVKDLMKAVYRNV